MIEIGRIEFDNVLKIVPCNNYLSAYTSGQIDKSRNTTLNLVPPPNLTEKKFKHEFISRIKGKIVNIAEKNRVRL